MIALRTTPLGSPPLPETATKEVCRARSPSCPAAPLFLFGLMPLKPMASGWAGSGRRRAGSGAPLAGGAAGADRARLTAPPS